MVSLYLTSCSQEEWKLVKIHVGWNVTNLTSVDGNLISKHARSRNFDGVSPVVVVVAKGISEVQDGFLRDLGGVASDVEMGWLHGSLGHTVGNEEEVEGTVNDLGLLDEALVHVGSLWRVGDALVWTHVEEALSYPLVDDDQSVLG
jgi:hypothetical protein